MPTAASVADRVFTNGEVHTLCDPDETAEAVAVRDGEIIAVESAATVDALIAPRTDVIDLDGRVLLPGFIDANFYSETLGQYLLYADLRDTDGPEECIERLKAASDPDREWIIGRGFDESTWDDARYLDRTDLNRVSEDRPVVALREDGHVAAVNDVMLERHREEFPDSHVVTEGGDPTGVLLEEAAVRVIELIDPDLDTMRELILAVQEYVHQYGVTGVHDMVRDSHAPQVYRELDLDDRLALRVRLNYWYNHYDAITETGLRTNHGSEFVQFGAVKFTIDGSLGGRTAKLTEPYSDGEGTGEWVMAPETFADWVARVAEADFQVCCHAIGDAGIEAVLSAYEQPAADASELRHRIEHVEMASDDQIDRIAQAGVVASMQPNFLKWAQPQGLYQDRIGTDRRERTNRYPAFRDAGARIAFGSDIMPLDPLYGVHRTVNAPVAAQQLSVTEALRAYTLGSAHAGFDEDRLGTVEIGKEADFAVLDRSPWEHDDAIDAIDVVMTVVDGDVVYDDR
ncbi:MAG: amidohydrolase [Halobacteriales archaeon]|nr:amidohydrolase [Halobacteriales archaeon]